MHKSIIWGIVFFTMAIGCSSQKSGDASKNPISQKIKAVWQTGPTNPTGWPFKEATDQYGLLNVKGVRFYAIDLNLDLKTDLVVLPEHYSIPMFYLFNPTTKKFELNKRFPSDESFRASYLNFQDFNKDGLVDMLVGSFNQKGELEKVPLRLFLGSGPKGDNEFYFVEMDAPIYPTSGPTASVSVLDYNLDGQLDLYLANWYRFKKSAPLAQPDRLLKGSGPAFEEVSFLLEGEHEYNPDGGFYLNALPSYGSSTCDIDQNGIADILVANSNGHSNKLWMGRWDANQKRVVFLDKAVESRMAHDEVGALNATGGGHTYHAVCSDYNNDSVMDVFLGERTVYYESSEADRSSVLSGSQRGYPPKFIRTQYSLGDTTAYTHQADRRGVWVDLNFDGKIDLLVDNSGHPPHSRLIHFVQNDDHSFDNFSRQHGLDVLNPSGTIILDVNNDGRPDILTGQVKDRNAKMNNQIYLFENNYPYTGNKIIRFKLAGSKSNPMGLGAMIIFKTDKSRQRQWVEYSSGPFPSQHEEGLFFGIPKGETAKSVKVRWPIVDKVGKPKVITYNLKNLRFKQFIRLQLRENGTFKSY